MEYVANAIDQARFVLQVVNEREAFCSELITKVYATHLRKITTLKVYEDQVGTLALATVAVERGLTLFITGEDALN